MYNKCKNWDKCSGFNIFTLIFIWDYLVEYKF